MKRPTCNHIFILVCIATWLAVAYSMPLRETLNDYGVHSLIQYKLLFFAACIYAFVLSLAGILNVFKPLAVVFILIAAPASFYMTQYGILIDADMLINAIETDSAEAADQLSSSFFASVFMMGVIPSAVLLYVKIPESTILGRVKQGIALMLCFTILSTGFAFTNYDDFASLFRNHRDVKYRIVPFNVIAAGVSVIKQKTNESAEFIRLGEDAVIGHNASSKPRIMVVVLGETARSDHFSVNGYSRDTTPRIEQLAANGGVFSYNEATSCGTATAISVPCMFSFYNADNYDSAARNTSNVLDVLQTAGIKVTWVENNSGCKNVCDRVDTIMMAEADCGPDGCFDSDMLGELSAWMNGIDRDAIIVLHQMGSHGPAYFARSPHEFKQFLPECETPELTACRREEIVNAYDNSLIVTDHLIAEVIEQVQNDSYVEASVIYVSDHGESLGDNGVYLHGLPNWLAPREQRHIPWVVWPKARFITDTDAQAKSISHDNFSHTLLGYFNVETTLYDNKLDLTKQTKDKEDADIAP